MLNRWRQLTTGVVVIFFGEKLVWGGKCFVGAVVVFRECREGGVS